MPAADATISSPRRRERPANTAMASRGCGRGQTSFRARRLSRRRARANAGNALRFYPGSPPDRAFAVAAAGPHGAVRVGTGRGRASGARVRARCAGACPDADRLCRPEGDVAAAGTPRAGVAGSTVRGRDRIYRGIQGAEDGARALGHGHVRALVSDQGAHAGDAVVPRGSRPAACASCCAPSFWSTPKTPPSG